MNSSSSRDGREDQTYRVLIPQVIQATYRNGTNGGRYDISANFVPKLTVRTAGAYTEESEGNQRITLNIKSKSVAPPADFPKDMLYEYALNMPKDMLMKVAANGKEAPIAFQWPIIPFRIWQPMRYDLGNSYDLFFSFLQEAESRM